MGTHFRFHGKPSLRLHGHEGCHPKMSPSTLDKRGCIPREEYDEMNVKPMKNSVKTKIENMKLYELPRNNCNHCNLQHCTNSSVHPQGLFTARCQQHTKLWHLKPTGGSLKLRQKPPSKTCHIEINGRGLHGIK